MSYGWGFGIVMILIVAAGFGCASVTPDTGVTGQTINCDGEVRQLVNCRKAYDQYARTVRFDLARIRDYATGFGVGAKKLMQLDAVSSDLIAHQRQLCVDYNNCIMSKEGYRKEMAFLRRAQLKVREAAAQLGGAPPGMAGDMYSSSEGYDPDTPKSPPSFEQLLAQLISDLTRDDEDYNGGGYYEGDYYPGDYSNGTYYDGGNGEEDYGEGTYQEPDYKEPDYQQGGQQKIYYE